MYVVMVRTLTVLLDFADSVWLSLLSTWGNLVDLSVPQFFHL